MTRENAVEIKRKVLSLRNSGDNVLDFSGVRTVDSSAVSLVMSFVRETNGKDVSIINPPVKLVDLMKLYGVYDSLKGFLR